MLKKRIILMAFAVVLLIVLGGGGFLAFKAFSSDRGKAAEPEKAKEPHKAEKGKEPHKTEKSKEPPKSEKAHSPANSGMGPVYAMDPFLVNLADPGRSRFLKVVLSVETDAEAVSGELDGLKPKVRDSLLTLLSSKTVDGLVSVADKERLRNEIIHRLNAFLSTGKVVEVYFTEFVVQ